jgi:hypothetical protein
VWWRPSLTIPWRAPRQSRARPHLHLPRARLRRSYDILRTPHGGLCNLHCPQHRTPTPHLHPSPAPLDLTPASTVTRPAAPHTPPGPLAYGAGDGRGTAEEPYMLCVVLITCMTRPRSISAEIATSRAELGSASTPQSTVHRPQPFPPYNPYPYPNPNPTQAVSASSAPVVFKPGDSRHRSNSSVRRASCHASHRTQHH